MRSYRLIGLITFTVLTYPVFGFADFRESSHQKTSIQELSKLRPELGLQLYFSPSVVDNLKANNFFTTQGFANTSPSNPSISAAGIMADYQPSFLQFFGVFDLGISAGFNPLFGDSASFSSSILNQFSLGVQARYQLRVYDGQPLVPVIGYYADYFFYNFDGSNSTGSAIKGRQTIFGPLAGIWLLLNWMEPSTASQYYINAGASRSYLTFEVRKLTTVGGDLPIGGYSYVLGLRSEF